MGEKRKLIDLTGSPPFGKWTVIERSGCIKGNAAWLCKCECGTVKRVNGDSLRSNKSTSCGCTRSERCRKKGKDHYNFVDGKSIDKRYGYVRLLNPKDFPGWVNYKHKYVFEHRVVMARHLGRALLKNENVHHINGVKTDNRISNLELWVRTQPIGQRAKDLVAWAKEILRQYEPQSLTEEVS